MSKFLLKLYISVAGVLLATIAVSDSAQACGTCGNYSNMTGGGLYPWWHNYSNMGGHNVSNNGGHNISNNGGHNISNNGGKDPDCEGQAGCGGGNGGGPIVDNGGGNGGGDNGGGNGGGPIVDNGGGNGGGPIVDNGGDPTIDDGKFGQRNRFTTATGGSVGSSGGSSGGSSQSSSSKSSSGGSGGDNLGGIMGQRLLAALNEAQENYQKAADRVASLEAQQPVVEPAGATRYARVAAADCACGDKTAAAPSPELEAARADLAQKTAELDRIKAEVRAYLESNKNGKAASTPKDGSIW